MSEKDKLLAALSTEGEKKQCAARTKSCRKCGYRYEAGDKTWVCPDCGENRRCLNTAIAGKTTCKSHGSAGGRPPADTKWPIPEKLAEDYLQAVGNPEFLSLAMNIGIVEARTAELLRQYDEADTRGAHEKIIAIVMQMGRMDAEKMIDGTGEAIVDWKEFENLQLRLLDAIQPVAVEASIWDKIATNLLLTQKLNETERKFIDAHDDMVPYLDVRYTLARVIQMSLKYITAPQDRQRWAKELREAGVVDV